MIEVPAVVAAQDPKTGFLVEGRVHDEERLQPLGHRLQLGVREDAVDAAVETPDELARPDVLEQKRANPVNQAWPELGLDHQHRRTLQLAQRARQRQYSPMVP